MKNELKKLPNPPNRQQLATACSGYFDTRKTLIETAGFIGVIASLFLQVDLSTSDPAIYSLRTVQALLLVVFCFFLTYALFDFQRYFFGRLEKNIWTYALGLIFATVSLIFIFHLASFITLEFWSGLSQYWRWTKYEVVILVALFLEYTSRWMRTEPDSSAKKALRIFATILWLVRTLVWLTIIDVFLLVVLMPRTLIIPDDLVYLAAPAIFLLTQAIVLINFLVYRKDKKFFFGYIAVIATFTILVNKVLIPFAVRYF